MPYLDHELSDPTRSVLEQHLATCDDCSAYLASYTTTVQLLQTYRSLTDKAPLRDQPPQTTALKD